MNGITALYRGIILAALFAVQAEGGQKDEPDKLEVTSQLAVAGANVVMTLDQPIKIRATGFDYDHTLQVALPATYRANPDKQYPVLWLMDGPLMLNLTMGVLDALTLGQRAPEMFVVAVGSANEEGLVGMERRRTDFTPPGRPYYRTGFEGALQRKVMPEDFSHFPQKADRYLNFLIDQARPILAAKYRMNNDHALFGHSHGGLFSAYAIFARPEEFSKYMVGSPYLYGVESAVFEDEAEYARIYDDLNVSGPLSLTAQTTHEVAVLNNFFEPADLDIEVGDTVRWTNIPDVYGGPMHDVTEAGFAWASVTAESFIFSRTFNSVEEVNYFCSVHPSIMRGSISVTQAGGEGGGVILNAFFNDSYRDAIKKGNQGVFIIIYPETGFIWLAWFTYDIDAPDGGIEFTLGHPSQAWYTVLGVFSGDTAVLDLELSTGGIFVSDIQAEQTIVGTITIKANSCGELVMTYEIFGTGLMGEIVLSRVLPDGIPACEQSQTQ